MSASAPKSAMAWITHEEIWLEAERLVVEEGWEYARVAEELRVPLSTLQKRAAKGGWKARRRETISYQSQVRKLKAKVLADTLTAWEGAETTDERLKAVQLIHAWRGLETAFPESRYPRPAETDEEAGDSFAVMTEEELQAYIAKAKT